ncbi:uncharacterized protein EI90DRAFT_3025046 [Cantharellus anzutake]|uniref:uncharacterized protein n=1 Tax=Cantharellus anzutake TaxID=1750568 RepID=UPI001905B4EB|nr:uncharacterized protein EI90DRAFT_3025046 [Cantharellus anzutake]KAF8309598.1 hypothetical protein EI90DRAFT_3025046 [Cantharellus anzutake]
MFGSRVADSVLGPAHFSGERQWMWPPPASKELSPPTNKASFGRLIWRRSSLERIISNRELRTASLDLLTSVARGNGCGHLLRPQKNLVHQQTRHHSVVSSGTDRHWNASSPTESCGQRLWTCSLQWREAMDVATSGLERSPSTNKASFGRLIWHRSSLERIISNRELRTASLDLLTSVARGNGCGHLLRPRKNLRVADSVLGPAHFSGERQWMWPPPASKELSPPTNKASFGRLIWRRSSLERIISNRELRTASLDLLTSVVRVARGNGCGHLRPRKKSINKQGIIRSSHLAPIVTGTHHLQQRVADSVFGPAHFSGEGQWMWPPSLASKELSPSTNKAPFGRHLAPIVTGTHHLQQRVAMDVVTFSGLKRT